MTPFMSWNHQGKLPKLQNILQQKHLPQGDALGSKHGEDPGDLWMKRPQQRGESTRGEWRIRLARWRKGRTKYRASVYNGLTICSYAYKAVTQFFLHMKKIKDTKINDQHGFTQCTCCPYLSQWNISSECVVALQNHDSPLIKAPR